MYPGGRATTPMGRSSRGHPGYAKHRRSDHRRRRVCQLQKTGRELIDDLSSGPGHVGAAPLRNHAEEHHVTGAEPERCVDDGACSEAGAQRRLRAMRGCQRVTCLAAVDEPVDDFGDGVERRRLRPFPGTRRVRKTPCRMYGDCTEWRVGDVAVVPSRSKLLKGKEQGQ